jgi:hypothetical protein
MPIDDKQHAYKHELEFIAGLGRWSDAKVDRGDLLARYLGACTNRSAWGDMRKQDVINAVQRAIAKL